MLRGSRHVAVALGLVLIAGSANAEEPSGPALEGKPVPTVGKTESGTASQNRAADQPSVADKLLPALDKIETTIRKLIPKEDQQEGQRKEQREVSDLQAQQDMALWAERMFWATLATVGLTFSGLLLIWRTLVHTRRAANYAEDMVREAEAATRATQKAAEVSETAYRNLERPYLLIDMGRPRLGERYGQGQLISFAIKNLGRTAAIIDDLTRDLILEDECPFASVARRTDKHFAGTILPGSVGHQDVTVNLTRSRPSPLAHFWLCGVIKYRDAVGQKYWAEFCYTAQSDPNYVLIDADHMNRSGIGDYPGPAPKQGGGDHEHPTE